MQVYRADFPAESAHLLPANISGPSEHRTLLTLAFQS